MEDAQPSTFKPQLLCPSATPEHWNGQSLIFGVVLGTPEQPQIEYLSEPQPASAEMLALSGVAEPSEVFRIATPCVEHGCRHFDGARCGLIERVVQILPVVTEALPSCRIRSSCRWWQQEGKAACGRCPQIATLSRNVPEKYQSLANHKENDYV